MKIRIFCLIFSLFCFFSTMNICDAAASEKVTRMFVDEVNHMGYYVDISTVRMDNDHQFTAEVSIVKPRENIMYVYNTRFDTVNRSYQYLTAKIFQYDTKVLLSQHNQPTVEQSYLKNYPIKEVAEFVVEWKRTHIH